MRVPRRLKEDGSELSSRSPACAESFSLELDELGEMRFGAIGDAGDGLMMECGARRMEER